jgi:hypothetical protein
MTTNQNDPLAAADARDGRRWLIGLGISVGFGLFGVVMALLAYFERTKTSAPPAAKAPAARGAEVKPDQDVRRRRDHK